MFDYSPINTYPCTPPGAATNIKKKLLDWCHRLTFVLNFSSWDKVELISCSLHWSVCKKPTKWLASLFYKINQPDYFLVLISFCPTWSAAIGGLEIQSILVAINMGVFCPFSFGLPSYHLKLVNKDKY